MSSINNEKISHNKETGLGLGLDIPDIRMDEMKGCINKGVCNTENDCRNLGSCAIANKRRGEKNIPESGLATVVELHPGASHG